MNVITGANRLTVATVPLLAVHLGWPNTVPPELLPMKLAGEPTDASPGPLMLARGPLGVAVGGTVALGGTAVEAGVASGGGVAVAVAAGRDVPVAGFVATAAWDGWAAPAVASGFAVVVPGSGVFGRLLPAPAPGPGPAERVPATRLSGVGVFVALSATEARAGVESSSPRATKNAPASSASPPSTSPPPTAVSALPPREGFDLTAAACTIAGVR